MEAVSDSARRERRQRVDGNFDTDAWNEELVLQRYELLYEAGLVPEAGRPRKPVADPVPGEPMRYDHRRILATGIARLRAKIKYRPVVFELMPPDFTLGQLQRAVEALAGRPLHKQNFRRQVEQQGLVEETGAVTPAPAAGRPSSTVSAARSCSNAPSPAPSCHSLAPRAPVLELPAHVLAEQRDQWPALDRPTPVEMNRLEGRAFDDTFCLEVELNGFQPPSRRLALWKEEVRKARQQRLFRVGDFQTRCLARQDGK